MIAGHGNDIYNFQGKIRCDFSSNIPYCNASLQIADYLSDQLHLIANYPDPYASILTQKIAAHHNLSTDNILVTNGSAEAFYLLAHLYAEKKSTITYPAFAEYEDACRLYNHILSFSPIKELQPDTQFIGDSAWLAVPNNPDGMIIGNNTIESICLNNPNTLFIIDNAYGELCIECPSIVPLHKQLSNLVSIHSLTKNFAIPGLRIGYIVAQKEVIEGLQNLRIPWSVNALAQEAGIFVMDNYHILLPDNEKLCNESIQFQKDLAAIPQLEVIHSTCNFFLVCMKEGNAAQLKEFLVNRYGLLIRNADNFRGLTPQHFRLSVQEEEMNKLLMDGINDFFRNSENFSISIC